MALVEKLRGLIDGLTQVVKEYLNIILGKVCTGKNGQSAESTSSIGKRSHSLSANRHKLPLFLKFISLFASNHTSNFSWETKRGP